MTKHNSCPSSVRTPPLGLWNTTDVVAFPNDHKYLLAHSNCCGKNNTIGLYKKRCFRFCNAYGNSSEIVSCLEDAGVSKATSFHNDKGGQSSMAAPHLSKPALGLVMMVLMGYVIGPLGEALLA
ncbi:hypothetical protein BDV25DRAFT_139581 [Aspergillus avenaceus]|uniref:Uncharacterized protein n=1 Tax=Aspergillus avenaceus TaxID=36643 RepID=A0A5N6TX68_ASPAV|nr:hypothetical protein BDV25DRAFT_139581 [Aspergillus avenaceus]